MDFSNEPYARYYRRKTTTWMLLCWEAQAILSEVLVLVDRAGVLELGGLSPAEAVSLRLPKWPFPVVEAGIADMLARRIVENRGDFLVWPRFIEAQTCRPRSPDHRRRLRSEITHRRHSIIAVLIERDGEGCRRCGAIGRYHVDHVLPVALGGMNDGDNLQLLCPPCNQSKGAR